MANLRCKVGDLAIITKCRVGEHVGLMVEVASARPTPDHDWRVRILGGPVRGCCVYSGEIRDFTHAAVYDWNLTPIRGKSCLDDGAISEELQFSVPVYAEVGHA